MLAIDFTTTKAFAWDLDIGDATLEVVQGQILKFFAEHDCPVISHSDNGCQFRNVIQAALENSLGVKPRHIPPGRPQANGLVEAFNRILDAAHGGERKRLMSAVLAHNNKPCPQYGVSPETLWRALRPLVSRWRNAGLKSVLGAPKKDLTEEEWTKYIDDNEHFMQTANIKEICDNIEAKVGPIKEAIESQQMRTDMARRLSYSQKKSNKAEVALMSGDRVIYKNTQYTTRTGKNKFKCQEGRVREFRVVSIAKGIVQLEDLENGKKLTAHGSHLKPMPKAMPAHDPKGSKVVDVDLTQACPDAGVTQKCLRCFGQMVPCDICILDPELKEDKWDVVEGKTDGGCLYRALSMGVAIRNKDPAPLFESDKRSQKMRSDIVEENKSWVEGLGEATRREVVVQVRTELIDDPHWSHRGKWNWDKYYEYASKKYVCHLLQHRRLRAFASDRCHRMPDKR